jgi:hypothetical protein
MIEVGVAGGAGERQPRSAPEQRPERDGELGAGEGRADAEVDAGAEGEMRGGAARVEAVRLGAGRRIATG